MSKYIYDMLLMSISSSIMYLAAQLLYRNMGRKYARWYYAMLVTAALMLVLPVHTAELPKMMRITVPQNIAEYSPVVYAAPQHSVTVSEIIFAVWAAAAAVMLVRMSVKYFKTRRTLLKASTETHDKAVIKAYGYVRSAMGIKKKISIRVSGCIHTPLLFGIFRPMIIVPDSGFTYDELVMIMAHELTHYRHRDLLIKLVTSVGVCIQWFNPAAYFLSKSLNNACELCCDESVLDMLELKDKKAYGRLIISVIEASVNSKLAYTTAMAATENGIQKRLLKIVEFKRPSVPLKIVCVMLLVSIAVCSVTAFGLDFAKEVLPDEAVQVIERLEDTPVIPLSSAAPETAAPQTESPAPNSGYRQTSAPERRSTAAPIRVENTAPSEAPVFAEPAATEPPVSTAVPSAETTPLPVGEYKPAPTEEPVSRENTKPVDIVINESINFDGNHITEDNRRQIEAAAENNLSVSEGQEVKAYIRVNDDGSYDLMRMESE